MKSKSFKSGQGKDVTLVGANTILEGSIRFSGELYVNGAVVGDIAVNEGSAGTLVVSEEGSVKGDLRVSNIDICGRVEGDVHADVRIELGKSAHVRGDMYYKLIEVRPGAIIDGRMVPQEDPAANVHELSFRAREDENPDMFNQ